METSRGKEALERGEQGENFGRLKEFKCCLLPVTPIEGREGQTQEQASAACQTDSFTCRGKDRGREFILIGFPGGGGEGGEETDWNWYFLQGHVERILGKHTMLRRKESSV